MISFELAPIGALALVFIILAVTGIVSDTLQISPILLIILFGMLLGPNGINVITYSPELNILKQLGLIILLFLAGIDFKFDNIMAKLKNAILIATPPAVVGFGLAGLLYFFHWFTNIELILLGLILTTTSISLSISVLREKLDQSEDTHDTVVLAIIISNVVMILVAGLITNSIQKGSLDLLHVAWNFIIVICFIVIILYLSRNVHLYWLDRFARAESRSEAADVQNRRIQFAFGLLGLILLIAYLLNIDLAIAAFFAGIYTSHTTRIKKQALVKLNAIGYGLLVPIFFFTMGMQVDLANFFNPDILLQVVVILVLSFVFQVSLTTISSYMADFPLTESIYIGIGLSACSLSGGFAVLTIGYQAGAIGSTTYSIFAAIITLSVLMTIIGMEIFERYNLGNAGSVDHSLA